MVPVLKSVKSAFRFIRKQMIFYGKSKFDWILSKTLQKIRGLFKLSEGLPCLEISGPTLLEIPFRTPFETPHELLQDLIHDPGTPLGTPFRTDFGTLGTALWSPLGPLERLLDLPFDRPWDCPWDPARDPLWNPSRPPSGSPSKPSLNPLWTLYGPLVTLLWTPSWPSLEPRRTPLGAPSGPLHPYPNPNDQHPYDFLCGYLILPKTGRGFGYTDRFGSYEIS